ncbi:hypothetical protein TNCV_484001 [Trichonephila clavipes]|nr:hypothetical protein TNCV_484001 [Trichonephila clavipes]
MNRLTSHCSATRGLWATDHVILNHGQVTWTTPELAPPSPNYHTPPTGGRLSFRQILRASLPYTADLHWYWARTRDKVSHARRGLLVTDHVILNHGQVTWMTPELAPPSLNYHTTPMEGRLSSRQIERASLPYTAGLYWYWARTRDKASHDPIP